MLRYVLSSRADLLVNKGAELIDHLLNLLRHSSLGSYSIQCVADGRVDGQSIHDPEQMRPGQ